VVLSANEKKLNLKHRVPDSKSIFIITMILAAFICSGCREDPPPPPIENDEQSSPKYKIIFHIYKFDNFDDTEDNPNLDEDIYMRTEIIEVIKNTLSSYDTTYESSFQNYESPTIIRGHLYQEYIDFEIVDRGTIAWQDWNTHPDPEDKPFQNLSKYLQDRRESYDGIGDSGKSYSPIDGKNSKTVTVVLASYWIEDENHINSNNNMFIECEDENYPHKITFAHTIWESQNWGDWNEKAPIIVLFVDTINKFANDICNKNWSYYWSGNIKMDKSEFFDRTFSHEICHICGVKEPYLIDPSDDTYDKFEDNCHESDNCVGTTEDWWPGTCCLCVMNPVFINYLIPCKSMTYDNAKDYASNLVGGKQACKNDPCYCAWRDVKSIQFFLIQ